MNMNAALPIAASVLLNDLCPLKHPTFFLLGGFNLLVRDATVWEKKRQTIP